MTAAGALVLAAMLALASPARADPDPCNTAAARAVMAKTLPRAADEHPVHITFRTRSQGAKLPARLVAQYPDEMTIILQYQFTRLIVRDDRFKVTVWFKGRKARLTIPFDAVKAFFDNNIAKCAGD